MSEYLLLAVSILCSVSSGILLRKFKNRTFKTAGDCFLLNGGVSLVWIVVLLFWSLVFGDVKYSPEAVVYGIIYGIMLCLFLYFRTQATACGPIALTTLVGNSAFIIATWFGVVYASEKINFCQIFGIGLSVLALYMCVNPQKSTERLTPKWFIYVIAYLLANGLIGIFYKVFGKSNVSNQINVMMLTAAITSAILFWVMGYAVNFISKKEPPTIRKKAWIYILLTGSVGCIGIRLTVLLANMIPSAVFFPVSNGMGMILTTIAGRVWFKEKLGRIQKAGVVIGLSAVVVIGCADIIGK